MYCTVTILTPLRARVFARDNPVFLFSFPSQRSISFCLQSLEETPNPHLCLGNTINTSSLIMVHSDAENAPGAPEIIATRQQTRFHLAEDKRSSDVSRSRPPPTHSPHHNNNNNKKWLLSARARD